MPEAPVEETPKPVDNVVRHTLFDDIEVEKQPFEGYIKTTDFLRSLNVSFKEVEAENVDEYDQVTINKMNVNEFVIVEAPKREEPKQEENREVEAAK